MSIEAPRWPSETDKPFGIATDTNAFLLGRGGHGDGLGTEFLGGLVLGGQAISSEQSDGQSGDDDRVLHEISF